ncbi:HAMP domain-containing protein [Candidatus Uhrbacteria bacterium]|nr:HAMP domain-containing protein [Candidatus Uhrbacteria bacterium]
MHSLSRFGIVKQFVFLFVLIFLIPILTLGGFFAIEVFRVEQQNIAELAYSAQLQKDRIEATVLSLLPDPNVQIFQDAQISFAQYQIKPTPENLFSLNADLEEIHKINSAYRRVFVLDGNGAVVASTSPSDIGQSYKDNPLFSRVSPIFGFREFEWGKQMLFGYYRLGTINIKIDLSFLIELQESFSALSQTGEIELVRDNFDGTVELITPPRFFSQTQFSRTIPFSASLSPEVRALNRTPETSPDLIDYRGEHVFAATQYLSSLDWGLVVKKDRAEILVPISNLRTVVFFAIPLSFLLFILAGLYLKRHITTPIQLLTQTARRIKKGDFSARVNLNLTNEIGELATAFNTMSDELIDANRNLEKRVKQKTARLERTLKELEEKRQKDVALLSSIGESVIATDTKGNIVFINQSAEQLLDVKRKDAVGVPVFGLVPLQIKGEKLESKKHPVTQTIRHKLAIRTKEFEFIRRGESLIVEVTSTPVEFDGKIFGAMMVIHDVTQVKVIDRMKSEFIFLASHQLRGPLASLKWYNEMFLKGEVGKLTKDQSRFMTNMGNATARMIRLVDDFLNIARIERGEIKFEPTQVAIEKVIQEVLQSLSEEIQKKFIRVQFENLSRAQTAFTDERMVREVISNIVQNAVKYSPEKTNVTIHLSDNNGQMRIEVSDQGPGIPEISQPHIFSKFFRGANIPATGSVGTGLGLYTAKSLIDRIGGTIGFSSKEGKGSTFWITLPIKPSKTQNLKPRT